MDLRSEKIFEELVDVLYFHYFCFASSKLALIRIFKSLKDESNT